MQKHLGARWQLCTFLELSGGPKKKIGLLLEEVQPIRAAPAVRQHNEQMQSEHRRQKNTPLICGCKLTETARGGRNITHTREAIQGSWAERWIYLDAQHASFFVFVLSSFVINFFLFLLLPPFSLCRRSTCNLFATDYRAIMCDSLWLGKGGVERRRVKETWRGHAHA